MRYLILLVLLWCIMICKSSAEKITLHPDVLNMHADFLMPYTSDYHYSIRRIKQDNHFTVAVSINLTVHQTISCNSRLFVSVDGLVQEKFVAITDGDFTLYSYLNEWPDSVIGASTTALRNCVTPFLDCPILPGVVRAIDCTLSSSEQINIISKVWNVSFLFRSEDEVPIANFWVTMEFDDTNLNRAKKPSSNQMRRRKQNRQSLIYN